MRNKRLSAILVGTGLVVTALFAYAGVPTNGFVTCDDEKYIVGNRQVRAGLTPAGIQYAWTTFDCSNWHPVTWLSLELAVELTRVDATLASTP